MLTHKLQTQALVYSNELLFGSWIVLDAVTRVTYTLAAFSSVLGKKEKKEKKTSEKKRF